MRMLKHLPVAMWPEADRHAFAAAYLPGDIFDDTTGPGAHLGDGTRRMIQTVYRRWLGFLSAEYPEDLAYAPAERFTPARIRAFTERLRTEVRQTTVAHAITNLHYAARLIDPQGDWRLLKEVGVRLAVGAHRIDRFNRLVPPARTLDFGIELMDTAFDIPVTSHWKRYLQYRDGLIIVFLSLWPIRRRSITALIVEHLSVDNAGVVLRLGVPDTKAKREENNRLPAEIIPYVRRYLDDVRPILLHGHVDDCLWPSRKGGRIQGGGIYSIVRKRIRTRFGKDMGLHDMRRAAATYIAMDMPDKIGLIPGVLQQAGPEVGEQHYNLANAMNASVRYADTMASLKDRLRAKKKAKGDS